MPTQSETGSSKHPLPQRVDEESKELTSPSTLPLSGSGKRALTTSHPGIRKRRTDRRSGQHGNSGIIRAHSAVLCFLISVHDFSLLDDFIEKLFVDANFICDKSHTTILSSFSELPMTPKRLVFLKKLLDHGGDVCRKDEDGTPIAIKMIKLELEQFIRGHVGACYALTDRDGRTPFWWLIRYYSTRAIPSNLQFSTSLLSTTNAADKFGVTPFLLAITSCNPSLLRLLANYGDPFATTSDGITLLRLATESCLDGNQLIEITNIIIDLRLDGFLGPLSF
jgi:ankyrin repeat protein